MEKDIINHQYDSTPEDLKLKSFVENSKTKHMDITTIKLKTFMKIREEQRRQKQHRLFKIAAIAAGLLLVVGVGLHFMMRTDSISAVQYADAEDTNTEVMQSVNVPVGETMTILLADGSKIIANSRTELLYPKSFKGETREVVVKGEAYFDIAHDESHPFIVKTNDFTVKVLGTQFNVSNYDHAASNVVLVQGAVELSTSNKDVVRMKPSDKVDISNGSFTSKSQVDPNDYISWTEGVIHLHGETIQSIVQRLNHHYGVQIVCDDHGDTPLYGKLVLQPSVYDVLHTINDMAHFKMMKKDQVIHLVSNL